MAEAAISAASVFLPVLKPLRWGLRANHIYNAVKDKDLSRLTREIIGLSDATGALARASHKSLTPSSTDEKNRRTLYHYTDAAGYFEIGRYGHMEASTKAADPRYARHGDSVYFTDLPPGTPDDLLIEMLWNGNQDPIRVAFYYEIDASNIPINGPFIDAQHTYAYPNKAGLNIMGREVSHGKR